MSGGMVPRPGHLRWPYPVERCASADCADPVLTRETEAVLFGDLETNKFAVFCGVCSLTVELFRSDRFRLVGA